MAKSVLHILTSIDLLFCLSMLGIIISPELFKRKNLIIRDLLLMVLITATSILTVVIVWFSLNNPN